jgi:hypothetical protein
MFIFAPTLPAGMVKLVDMPDLGSGAARRVGSSPITRTKKLLSTGSFFISSTSVNLVRIFTSYNSFQKSCKAIRLCWL